MYYSALIHINKSKFYGITKKCSKIIYTFVFCAKKKKHKEKTELYNLAD